MKWTNKGKGLICDTCGRRLKTYNERDLYDYRWGYGITCPQCRRWAADLLGELKATPILFPDLKLPENTCIIADKPVEEPEEGLELLPPAWNRLIKEKAK